MRSLLNVLLMLFTLSPAGRASQQHAILGRVVDAASGAAIAGARAALHPGTVHPARSDSSGRFALTAVSFPCTVVVSHAAYETVHLVLESPPPAGTLAISLSARLYVVPEVIVTSTPIRSRAGELPSSVSVLGPEQIGLSPGTALSDVLVGATGVFVKDYGGGGSVKTLTERGLGAEQTLVMIDGVSVSSLQTGVLDLGSIPEEWFERVEVIRGGQSASFGTQAMGGVINLVPRPLPSGPTARAGSRFGSCGYQRVSAEAGTGSPDGGILLGIVDERSVDNYAFEFLDGTTPVGLERANADYHARYYAASGTFATGSSSLLRLDLRGTDASRGVPGPVVSRYSGGSARQEDDEGRLQVGWSHVADGGPEVRVRAHYHDVRQRYTDPELVVGGSSLDNSSRLRDAGCEPGVVFPIAQDLKLAAGGLVSWAVAEGNTLDGKPGRVSWGGYAVAEYRVLGTVPGETGLLLVPAARYDHAGDSLTALSPQFGARLTLTPFDVGPLEELALSVRAVVGRNFRIPTFNELYYAGGGGFGNSALRSEQSTGGDAGVELAFLALGRHSLDATLFAARVRDRIVWVPAGGAAVTPKNLRTVESSGLEITYGWNLPRGPLALRAGYAFTRARKTSADYPGDPNVNTLLVYVPEETAHASVQFTQEFGSGPVAGAGGTLRLRYVSHRFVTEDNQLFLPSYTCLDLALTSDWRLDPATLQAGIEITNLTNAHYQVVLGYPAPSRGFRVTVGVRVE